MIYNSKKAWIVAADMGFGHYRAALPLLNIANEGKIILANQYEGIPQKDKSIWARQEQYYSAISRFSATPIIGPFAFRIFDQFQKIASFSPHKKEHAPSMQLRYAYSLIKKGWGRHLIETLSRKPIPLFCSFSSIAYMADYWGYPAPIYLLLTDSDVSRAWASLDSQKSKIIYLAPTKRAADRLLTYGVPLSRIILTGFPLPQELQGENNEIAKRNFMRRLTVLDPRSFSHTDFKKHRPPCILFSLGGAGAQQNIGKSIIQSTAPLIKKNELHIMLALGTRPDIQSAFHTLIKKCGLGSFLNT
ncbi:MAG: hypothetical protein HY445_00785, partial [Candidatus Niyogibacteria bacterium]|nr:hypothetical protein [Candidatus Niyogibacteria bacterium]